MLGVSTVDMWGRTEEQGRDRPEDAVGVNERRRREEEQS